MNEKAELLFTQIFWRTTSRFSELETLRYVTKQTLPRAQWLTGIECSNIAHSWASDSYFDKFFTDKKGFFDIVGGVEGFASRLAQMRIQSYQTWIDDSCIVFAHSILDAAAFDCFRVIEIAAPLDDLLPFVGKRQVTIEEIKVSNCTEVFRDKIHQFILDLEKKSLLEKIDRLFQICKPPGNFLPIRGHEFDRKRVSELDGLRQEIVHGDGLKSPLSTCDDDVRYMRDTTSFLMCLVNYRYDIRVNPTLWKEWLQNKPPD